MRHQSQSPESDSSVPGFDLSSITVLIEERLIPTRSIMRRFAVLVTMAFLALTGPASAAVLHATPATLPSVYASAQGGDTILLASGAYSAFNGGAKPSMVTLSPEVGASPTFASAEFGTTVRNLTIKGVTYTGSLCIRPPSGVKMNVVIDGVTFGAMGVGCGEGRLSIRDGGVSAIDGNGVQIKNSTFGPGGCSDGIQDLSSGTEIGPGNEFKGIVQGGCVEHSDAIQPYASNYVHIHDNYLHDNEQGIMSPDGLSTGYLIENNVIHTATAYPCMHLGHTTNGTVRHNVCLNGSIRLFGGNENIPSANMTVQNNVSDIWNQSCTGCTVDHNLLPSQVTFTGGSGRCAYATAAPKGTGSDSTDIGLNDCGGTPPPPDTTPPNTTITSAPPNGTSTSASVSFTGTDNVGVTSYECRLDGAAFATCTSPKSYTGLSVGSHTVDVRAKDAAGNVDPTPATATWTVSSTPPPPGPFVNDTFTGTSATVLSAHTGQLGATWTAHPSNTGSTQLSSSGGVRETTTTGTGVYYASGVPASANYTVEADFNTRLRWTYDGDVFAHVLARADTSATTFYACRYSRAAVKWEIVEWNAGVPTVDAASSTATLVASTTYHVAFTVNGSSLSCSVNGATVATATDSTITSPGKVGIRLSNGTQSVNDGIHIDNLVATNL